MEHSIETYKSVIESQCRLEDEARKIAREVLSEQDVYGDSYGVPSIVDIVEQLVERVKTNRPHFYIASKQEKHDCNGCIMEGKCGGQL